MVSKKQKFSAFTVSMSLDNQLILREFARGLSLQTGEDVNRSDAINYAVEKYVKPRVLAARQTIEAAEAKLKGESKTPPVNPGVSLEVEREVEKTGV